MTYNENLVREAAYYNWQNAGCPFGEDEKFWNMAIEQIYGGCKSTKSCGCKSSSTKKTASSTSKKTTSTKAKSKK